MSLRSALRSLLLRLVRLLLLLLLLLLLQLAPPALLQPPTRRPLSLRPILPWLVLWQHKWSD
jgi:hypothetical protein